MPKLSLDRRALAQILQNNQQAIMVFERMFNDVGAVMPATIEEAHALAGQALTVAHGALASLSVLADLLAQLDALPAPAPAVGDDDCTPRAQLGTISSQDHDAVEIAGGTARLSTLALAGQMTSTLATGTAPLVVSSTTKVANLRVETADKLANPTTYPADATDLPTAIELVNAIKAANIAKGV